MVELLDWALLALGILFLLTMTGLGIYIAAKSRKRPRLPEGISAELKSPSYLPGSIVIAVIQLLSNAAQAFGTSSEDSRIHTAALIILAVGWLLSLILFIIELRQKKLCSITGEGIIISNGRTVTPDSCWYELDGDTLVTVDRKTGYRNRFIITGDIQKLDEILKSAYVRHA